MTHGQQQSYKLKKGKKRFTRMSARKNAKVRDILLDRCATQDLLKTENVSFKIFVLKF